MSDPHVDVPADGEGVEEIEYMDRVDVDEGAHRATEPDEAGTLREMYGEADQYGIYRGEAV